MPREINSDADRVAAAQSGTILCLYCLICTLALAGLALFVFGLVAVTSDSEARDAERVPHSARDMWLVCLLFVVAQGLSLATPHAAHAKASGASTAPAGEQHPVIQLVQSLAAICSLTALVWGYVVFARMDKAAAHAMRDSFHLLYLYFHIALWLTTAALCLACCGICVGLCAVCVVSSKAPDNERAVLLAA